MEKTTKLGVVLLMLAVLVAIGCQSTPEPANMPAGAAGGSDIVAAEADDLVVVDCLLPGQVRRLGKMSYLSQRRPVKIAASECQIRGGEYVAYDRSTLSSSLAIWLPQAQAGDEVAQTYVGEIYSKGIGGQPEFELAAVWFRKAAEQGHGRAQMNLGYLYERGLGVPKDINQAVSWYRKAGRLNSDVLLDAGSLSPEARQELIELKQDIERLKKERESLKRSIEQDQKQLQQSKSDLDRRQQEISARENDLKRAQSDLQKKKASQNTDTDSAEIEKLEQALARQSAELASQRSQTDALRNQIEKREKEINQYQTELKAYQQKLADLPAPKIEMIDPLPLVTRGVRIAPVDEEQEKRQLVGKIWAPGGISEFTVNQRPETVGQDGAFKAWIPIKRGIKTEVSLLAVDQQGKKSEMSFSLPPQAKPRTTNEGAQSFSASDFGNYHALIIGNAEYRHLPKLFTPPDDARALEELLRTRYGFKTELILDATRYDVLAALNRYRKKLTEKDNFLIFFAGHGELVEKNRRGYWLPIDADLDSDVNWLPNYQITDILNIMTAKQVLVIADTCYSGALTRSTNARLEPGRSVKDQRRWLETLTENRSRRVLTSGELKPVLDDGGGNHSIFAQALLDALASNEAFIEGLSLYQKVAANVALVSDRLGLQQVPQYAALIHAGHESGDFVFAPTVEN